MTATDELRRLLDERGVEYETYIEQSTGFEHVEWRFGENGSADFNLEFGEPWLAMSGVVSDPAQAVEATLGRGTCHNVHVMPRTGAFWPTPHFKCSECGAVHVSMEYVFYCPNCGREVIE